MDAEKGKPATSMAVYAALLWAYDLLQPLSDVASPVKDAPGYVGYTFQLETRYDATAALKPSSDGGAASASPAQSAPETSGK